MSTATVAELQAERFQASQFGETGGDFTAYLQAVLDEQALLVKERIGEDAYANANAIQINRIKRAERFLAAAELWLRRMNEADNDVVVGGESGKTEYRQFADHYQTYSRKAAAELAALPTATATPTEISSAPAFGAVVSSPFQQSVVDTATSSTSV